VRPPCPRSAAGEDGGLRRTNKARAPPPTSAAAAGLAVSSARMVNELQYCSRLPYLDWVQGKWAELADSVEGRGVHRRVDRGPHCAGASLKR